MAAQSRSGGGGKPPPRRDTPVDVLTVPHDEAPDTGLAVQSSLETLEAAYELWRDQKLRHAAALARHAEERRKIDDEAAFMVGAVRAAGVDARPPSVPGSSEALTAPNELDVFVRDAEKRIADARARLQARIEQEEAAFAKVFAELRATIVSRIQRTLATTRPSLRMVPRMLAGERRIVHVDRLGDDEAILLLYVLTGRIPSRYGFLLDDSTDDVLQAPPPLYPDEGVTQLRPGAAELQARVAASTEVLPIKGFLPAFVPTSGQAPAFYRFLQRGPVMEVELADGDQFRNVLTREEAERIAGHLLRLKLAGKLELELAAE